MERYDPKAIEPRWQGVWEDARAFHVSNPEPGADRNDRRAAGRRTPRGTGRFSLGLGLRAPAGSSAASPAGEIAVVFHAFPSSGGPDAAGPVTGSSPEGTPAVCLTARTGNLRVWPA